MQRMTLSTQLLEGFAAVVSVNSATLQQFPPQLEGSAPLAMWHRGSCNSHSKTSPQLAQNPSLESLTGAKG